MSDAEKGWDELFRRIFAAVKRKFEESFPFPVTDESALPSGVVTLRRTVQALPCAVKIMNLRVDPSRYDIAKGNLCQLVRYDFSRFGDDSVDYVGEVDVADTARLKSLLISEFNVNLQSAKSIAEDISREFRTAGFWLDDQSHFYFQITFYDLRKDPDSLVGDLWMLFRTPSLPESAFERFRVREIDFNTLYNLRSDRVASIEENMEEAAKRVYPKVSFEGLQEHVADIQLVPQVPEDVQRVFRCAKDLYVFAYFRYIFFTVSCHYAFLALESAIRHRYVQSLGAKATLTMKRGESHEILNPTYRGIEEFCSRNRWNVRTLTVNGEPFPHSTRKLLDWLVDRRIITRWERFQYDVAIYLRNSLSHLEKASILTPSPQIIRRNAYEINELFDQHH